MPNEGGNSIEWITWITLAAVFFGPIFAVFVTRFIDVKREKKMNRLTVFKTLMSTRGTRLNREHVGALNLVEIEFYNEEKVSNVLQKYLDHLNGATDSKNSELWLRTSDHLFVKLLSEMAKSLGYGIEQLQILTGGYAPQGWANDENRHALLQKMLIDLLGRKIALPITTDVVVPSTSQGGARNDDVLPQTVKCVVPPPGFPPIPS